MEDEREYNEITTMGEGTMPQKTTVPKEIHYEWAKPGDKGRLKHLPVESLLIDHSYQRGQASNEHTLYIARNFTWAHFGALTVMQRENGKYYVVDGQQRLLAAKKRSDIRALPCRVFRSLGQQHEAAAFLRINTGNKIVSAIDKFRAALEAGEQPHVDIDAWLKSVMLHVGNNGASSTQVPFPNELIRIWKVDPFAVRQAIFVMRAVYSEDQMDVCGYKGLVWLYRGGIDIEHHIDKLRASGGKTGIRGAIAKMQLQLSQPANYRICGLGILSILNRGRRTKKLAVNYNE